MNSGLKPIAIASVAVLSWSTVATAFKIALSHTSVQGMLLIACPTALVIFALYLTISHGWRQLRTVRADVLVRFALLGLIMPVAYYFVLFKAYDYLPAQVAQPVNYIWPIILAVLLSVIGRKPIPAVKYAGMAVSLAGVVLISMGGTAIDTDTPLSAKGISLALGSALLWAVYWIVNNSLKDTVSQAMSLFLTFFFGSIYLGIMACVTGVPTLTLPATLSGVYIGAFEMGIPFVCFGIAIRTTDNPALVNQLCYLAPFLSLFIISIVLHERIALSTCAGLALIVGGLVYNEFFAGRTRAPRSTKPAQE